VASKAGDRTPWYLGIWTLVAVVYADLIAGWMLGEDVMTGERLNFPVLLTTWTILVLLGWQVTSAVARRRDVDAQAEAIRDAEARHEKRLRRKRRRSA
jgi:hypothetical protein